MGFRLSDKDSHWDSDWDFGTLTGLILLSDDFCAACPLDGRDCLISTRTSSIIV